MEKLKMEKIQVEIIKKLLMLSSKNELVKVRSFISEAISRECDLDDEQIKKLLNNGKQEEQKQKTKEPKNTVSMRQIVALTFFPFIFIFLKSYKLQATSYAALARSNV